MRRIIGICSSIFLSLFFFSFVYAAAGSKQEAMNNALVAAEKSDAVAKATTKADYPATDYRQRLETPVSVEKAPQYGHEFDSYVTYMPKRSLKDQPGKIAIIENSSEYSYEFKAFDKLPIELSLNQSYININKTEDVPVSLPSQLTEVGFGAQLTLPLFFEKAYLRLKAQPTFYGDDWNVSSSTFKFPGFIYGIYQPTPKLTLVAGVAAYPGFERAILPFGGVIYQPNDKLLFNIVPPRPTISYVFTNRLSGFVEGNMSGGEYKVNKDDLQGKRLQYNELSAGLGLSYNVNKYIDASISGGGVFNRYLKYRDSLGKVNIKNGYYTEFRVEIGI